MGKVGGRGGPLETCTLLTTEANELLAPYRDRMPVILRPEDYEVWLDADTSRREILMLLLHPYPYEEMSAYAVSVLVNSPSNDIRPERKHDDGKKVEWLRVDAIPRIPMRPLSYQEREKLSSHSFEKFKEVVEGHGR